jgi:hypothetical protein
MSKWKEHLVAPLALTAALATGCGRPNEIENLYPALRAKITAVENDPQQVAEELTKETLRNIGAIYSAQAGNLDFWSTPVMDSVSQARSNLTDIGQYLAGNPSVRDAVIERVKTAREQLDSGNADKRKEVLTAMSSLVPKEWTANNDVAVLRAFNDAEERLKNPDKARCR